MLAHPLRAVRQAGEGTEHRQAGRPRQVHGIGQRHCSQGIGEIVPTGHAQFGGRQQGFAAATTGTPR